MEENVSNALYMAAAMFVFVIAVSLTFSLISQTKSTSDYVLYSYDDTKYYEEGYNGITYTLANESDIDRIVDMQTIIPTVYRYIKENYGVTIMKSDGTIIARFDETTESIMNDWANYLREAALHPGDETVKCKKVYNELKNIAVAAGIPEAKFTSKYRDYTALTALWEDIYNLNKQGASGSTSLRYGTPWLGDEKRITQRLNADFYGGDATYASGKHTGLNLLGSYEKKKFKEKYLFVTDNSGIEKDENTGDFVITKSNTSKLEIIYVML